MPGTIELDQHSPVVGAVGEGAPCISADELLAGGDDHFVETVRNACTETGFFFVDVTSSQRDVLEATLRQMERFFSLDNNDSRKQDSRQRERDYGWVPKYSEPAYQPGTVSALEAFDFGLANVDDPGKTIWPDLPGFRADATACWSEYVGLSEAVLGVLARAAGIEPDFLIDQCSSRSLNSMRLLHYDADDAARADDEVGIAAHTDFECITLLYQTAPGLELQDVNGRWLDAPGSHGRMVVLLGDMLERWTNGFFRASGHRVRRTDQRRYSIVMFVAVNDDIEVEPLPQFVSANRPSRYAPITQAQHIENEVRRAKQNAAARK